VLKYIHNVSRANALKNVFLKFLILLLIFLCLNFVKLLVSLIEYFLKELLNIGHFLPDILDKLSLNKSLIVILLWSLLKHCVYPVLWNSWDNQRNLSYHRLLSTSVPMCYLVNVPPNLSCQYKFNFLLLFLESKR